MNDSFFLLPCLLVLTALAGQALAQQDAPAPSVLVAETRRAAFVDRIEALGTVRANETVRVTASVSEKIVDLRFDDGEQVAAGQVLAILDKREEEANLKRARATLEERRIGLQRLAKLERGQLAAVEDVDQRRLAVEQVEAEIEAIEARIDKHVIRAPFAGIVGIRDISLGALVAPGDLIGTLDDLSIVKLDFSVPSSYLQTLRPGLEITATTDAFDDRRFTGEVSSVDTRVDPVTRSILVRARLPNPDRALRPGLLMRVELLKNAREALVIPEKALIPRGNTQSVLWVNEADGNRVERREVQIGARRPGEVEVLGGLSEGDKVVTDGTTRVAPGQVVRVIAVDDGSRALGDLLGVNASP